MADWGLELLKQVPALGVLVYLVLIMFQHVTRQRTDFLAHLTSEREVMDKISERSIKSAEVATEAIRENSRVMGKIDSQITANEQTLRLCHMKLDESHRVQKS